MTWSDTNTTVNSTPKVTSVDLLNSFSFRPSFCNEPCQREQNPQSFLVVSPANGARTLIHEPLELLSWYDKPGVTVVLEGPEVGLGRADSTWLATVTDFDEQVARMASELVAFHLHGAVVEHFVEPVFCVLTELKVDVPARLAHYAL